LRSSILDLRSSKNLAFRELEAFTRALLTVLLTLFGAGIAREQSGLFELLTQLGVELEQRARDAVTHCAGLTSNAAAVDVDHHVEFVDRVGQLQRLADDHAKGFVLEVQIDGGAVDFEIAAAGTQINSRCSALPPSGSVILHFSHVLKSLLNS